MVSPQVVAGAEAAGPVWPLNLEAVQFVREIWELPSDVWARVENPSGRREVHIVGGQLVGGASTLQEDRLGILLAAEGRYERALAHSETPERLYARQWCLTLLDGVFEALRAEYAAAGKAEPFDRLKGFLTGGAGTHADAARELGTSAGAVKVAVHRLRRRYREELRRRVADTVGTDNDVEDEIRYLLKTLGPANEGL